MAVYRRWVFELKCTDVRFRRAVEDVLQGQGLAVTTAKVHDLQVRGGLNWAYLTFGYHDRGIEVNVKAKGLGPRRLVRTILEAARAAQARIVFDGGE